MEIVHPIPWFPAWGVKFHKPINDLDGLISTFNDFRENNRWALLADEIVASEVHLWTSWYGLRRREERKEMIARTPDVEILRIMSGTHQIKSAFQRAGVKKGDERAWIIYIPEEEKIDIREVKIGRHMYSDKDDDARNLAEFIGAKIIPKRPIPDVNGLERIGIEGNFTNLNYSQIEDLFLTHMSLSEL
ncbi:MAG: KEOPS complex subunit Cgi121 [Candidatus Thalassarchaeaceae archaeon]